MERDRAEISVSVLCLCYNHESYIHQCLDSITGQKTEFPFEVLVHDDASTDQSAGIIREYERRFPGVVRGIYQTENLYSRDGFWGIQRVLLENSKGKYLAICECDDYWLDPYKLQKQYEAVIRHDAVFCAHRVRRVRDGGERAGGAIPGYRDGFALAGEELVKSIFTYDNPNCFVYQASSYFFRRDMYPDELPEFMRLCCVGDVPIVLFYAASGRMVYLAEEMSCYRVMSGSSWNRSIRERTERETTVQNNMIACLKAYEDYTGHRYDDLIERKICEIRLGILVLNGQFQEIRTAAGRRLSADLAPKKRLKFWLYGHCPRLMDWYDEKRKRY